MLKKKLTKKFNSPYPYEIIVETKTKDIGGSTIYSFNIRCVCGELFYLSEATTNEYIKIPLILVDEKKKFEEFYNKNSL